MHAEAPGGAPASIPKDGDFFPSSLATRKITNNENWKLVSREQTQY